MGARGEYPNTPQFDWHPTGRLTLTVGFWPSRKWNDTERSLIDSRLRGIVGLAALTPEKQPWIQWAKAKADWVDPLVRRSAPILDALEPEAPSFWHF